MKRTISEQTVVVRRSHQPLAEEILPYAIHGDTRGERILFVGDPLRQFEATAALIVKFREAFASQDR